RRTAWRGPRWASPRLPSAAGRRRRRRGRRSRGRWGRRRVSDATGASSPWLRWSSPPPCRERTARDHSNRYGRPRKRPRENNVARGGSQGEEGDRGDDVVRVGGGREPEGGHERGGGGGQRHGRRRRQAQRDPQGRDGGEEDEVGTDEVRRAGHRARV